MPPSPPPDARLYRWRFGTVEFDEARHELRVAGLAVDIATEDGSMFFPPVVGIVPDGVAVDSGAAEEGAARS